MFIVCFFGHISDFIFALDCIIWETRQSKKNLSAILILNGSGQDDNGLLLIQSLLKMSSSLIKRLTVNVTVKIRIPVIKKEKKQCKHFSFWKLNQTHIFSPGQLQVQYEIQTPDTNAHIHAHSHPIKVTLPCVFLPLPRHKINSGW